MKELSPNSWDIGIESYKEQGSNPTTNKHHGKTNIQP
jgi:hypothetical protein